MALPAALRRSRVRPSLSRGRRHAAPSGCLVVLVGLLAGLVSMLLVAQPSSWRQQSSDAHQSFAFTAIAGTSGAAQIAWPTLEQLPSRGLASRGCHGLLQALRPSSRGPGGPARALPADAAQEAPRPLFSAPLRRLELDGKQLVGAGYDLVQVRVLTRDQEPIEATFMLDTGLTTNLLSPEFVERTGLVLGDFTMEGAGLGGVTKNLQGTLVPGLELVGDERGTQQRYSGTWAGDGWRARATLDWDAWVAQAASSGGRVTAGEIEWSVLPSPNMTDEQVAGLVGRRGTEFVEGEIDGAATRFLGRGTEVTPRGFLAPSETYELRREGDELVDAISGMRLRAATLAASWPLSAPVHAVAVPFAQAELAKRQGMRIDGMLGQYPFHRDFVVEVDPQEQQLHLYRRDVAADVARSKGWEEIPGIKLGNGLFGVKLAHSPQIATDFGGRGASVPALVDSGAANSILNWPAAEQLLGITRSDRLVKDAPLIRAVGVGGGVVDMPLITLSLGLTGQDGKSLRPRPVRVAIGDAEIFGEIVGREESGSWPFGLGRPRLRPAALVGQDVLSQRPYLLAADTPALYMAPDPATGPGRLELIGEGDCVDTGGRRLQGLQKLACIPDDAAEECLSLPPGECQGVAVTPRGKYLGLCYVFAHSASAVQALEERGFRQYLAPEGQELAPAGMAVAASNGEKDAECFRWLLA